MNTKSQNIDRINKIVLLVVYMLIATLGFIVYARVTGHDFWSIESRLVEALVFYVFYMACLLTWSSILISIGSKNLFLMISLMITFVFLGINFGEKNGLIDYYFIRNVFSSKGSFVVILLTIVACFVSIVNKNRSSKNNAKCIDTLKIKVFCLSCLGVGLVLYFTKDAVAEFLGISNSALQVALSFLILLLPSLFSVIALIIMLRSRGKKIGFSYILNFLFAILSTAFVSVVKG